MKMNPPLSFEDVEAWLRSSALCRELKPLVLLIFQAVIYFLWKERNSWFHNSLSKPSQVVIKEIQLQIRARLLGLERERLSTSHSVTTAASRHTRTRTYHHKLRSLGLQTTSPKTTETILSSCNQTQLVPLVYLPLFASIHRLLSLSLSGIRFRVLHG